MMLEFAIKNQRLHRTDNVYLVNLSNDYLECYFTFSSDDWTGLDKYVTFTVKGKSYKYLLDDSNVVRVPNELMRYKYFYVKLEGDNKDNDTLITTNELIVILKITLDRDNLKPSSDIDSKDIITLMKEKLDKKIDHFTLSENQLLCYSEDNLVQIIPFDFLSNYYDKEEVDEMISHTIVDVDASELADGGFLIFRRYEI